MTALRLEPPARVLGVTSRHPGPTGMPLPRSGAEARQDLSPDEGVNDGPATEPVLLP